jgi:hypothetical protein
MALSNQSDGVSQFLACQFKNQPQHFPTQQFRKMTCRVWPNPGRRLIEIGQIPAYDKPEVVRPQNFNCRDLVSPASQFAKYPKRIWWNQQPKALFQRQGISACRKSEFLNWLSADWKTPVSHFDCTKPSQKSLSRIKGTVSRDFRLLVFFMNQFPPSIWVYHYGHFDFFRKFAEIFAAQDAPPVSRTPVANGKNLQAEKF